MVVRSRGAALVCGIICLIYAASGIFCCWPGHGTAQAGESGGLPNVNGGTDPATYSGISVSLREMDLAYGNLDYHLHWPVTTDPALNLVIEKHLAALLGLPAATLTPPPVEVLPSAKGPLAPLDLAVEQAATAAEPERRPTTVTLTYEAFLPTPEIAGLTFRTTTQAPGGAPLREHGTLVYDARTRRVVELSDLFGSEPGWLAGLSELVARRIGLAVLPSHPPIIAGLGRFVLTADSLLLLVDDPAGEVGRPLEVRLSYRDLCGMLRVRIGQPWPGASYPAYLEIPSSRSAAIGGRPSDGPMIALTFDDGPSQTVTRAILGELSKRHAVGTFCIIGTGSVRHKELLQDIVLQGSEIGNHTWNHWRLTDLSLAQVAEQVWKTQRFVEQVTGVAPAFVRPPAGLANSAVRAQFGVPAVYWSIDPRDWAGADAAAVAAHVLERARDGDIVLLHDTATETIKAVGMIVDGLSERGFRFVTVSELLDLRSGKAAAGSIWRNRFGP